MSDPCDLSIHHTKNPGDGRVVRIEARDGPKLLVAIELEPGDLAALLLDQATVPAAIEGIKS